MNTELKAGDGDLFNVLRNTDGETVAFVTPAGSVTSFDDSRWSVVWSGDDLDCWLAECLKANVEPQEVAESTLGKFVVSDSQSIVHDVEALRAGLDALKALPTSPPVVVERMTAVEQRTDANMLSMGQMVMSTKNELTLEIRGLQAQIDGLNTELANLRSKVN